MSINFPNSPSLNDTYTYQGRTWKWTGSAWRIEINATTTGYTGSAGTGFTGSAGTTGFAGSAGANGTIGVDGYTGSVGFTGSAGANGTIGVDGYTGSVGFTGSAGAGFTGSVGDTGSIGFTGSQGIIGYTGSAGTGGGGGGGSWTKISSNHSASSGDRLLLDTSGGSFNLTLPATPATGTYIQVTDGFNLAANSVTVLRNGSTIENDADDLILDLANNTVEFIFDGNTWQITSTTGPKGDTGYTGSRGFLGYSGSAGLSDWAKITANYTAFNRERLMLDTSSGSFTLTLPATPPSGTYIQVTDAANFAANNVIVNRNGSTIESQSENLLLDIANTTVEFIYDGTTWQVTTTTGPRGAIGFTGSQGIPGEAAAIGYTGSKGDTGSTGFTGSQGDIGYTGSVGVGYSGSIGGTGYTGSAGIGQQIKTMEFDGSLVVFDGTKRWWIPGTYTIYRLIAFVTVAPIGANIAIRLNKNGNSVSTLNIPATTTTANATVNISIAEGDYMTVDITSVGSTQAGQDLSFIIQYQS